MNKFIGIVLLLVGLGLGYVIPHGAHVNQQSNSGAVGGTVYSPYARDINNINTLQTGAIGLSSSTPAALGSSITGFFSATTTSQTASTTAITANSTILLQYSSSTPIGGLQCAALAPSSTVISKKIPGNGFVVAVNPAPPGSVTPYCFNYLIVN